ncbi:MAG: NifU N-terminal domain-containing protein [Gemmatimonadota bacterium]|nr:NifU N-terminal domain-containing protein [Gemmatimonadota bacterium]
MADVDIRVQQTPNPNSLLFHLDRTVTEERMVQYNSANEAEEDPLAAALFEIDGVASVFFMPNSITVSKDPGADWDSIAPGAEAAIRDHFGEG